MNTNFHCFLSDFGIVKTFFLLIVTLMDFALYKELFLIGSYLNCQEPNAGLLDLPKAML